MVTKTKETLDKVITLSNNSIDLPRNGVIQKVALLFNLTLRNADTTNAWSGTLEDVLKAIEEIRLVADANDIKYAISGLDLAIMNYYDSASKGIDLSQSISVPANGTQSVTFMLFMKGDVHAVAKENLALSIMFNTSVAPNVSISDATVKVTLDKLLFASAEEWYNYYNGQFIEPKVWTKKATFNASSELEEILDIPVGAIAWRGFITIYDSSDARADIVDKYAIMQTKPQRIEILKVDWETGKQLDKAEYILDSTLTGVNVIDYDSEVIEGGLDLRTADIGVFKLALKPSASGTIRYISHEYVVL